MPALLRRSIVPAALLALLVLHAWSRGHAAAAIPVWERPFYPGHYVVALSLAHGRGFQGFVLEHEAIDFPEAPTVRKFLAGHKEELRRGRLQVFLDTAWSSPPPAEAATRVLDMRVAGLLWRLFGVAWPVLSLFYVAVSTAACLLVFVLGARLGGAGAGLLAAALFFASPYEHVYSAFSMRDLSPLWFAALAICAVAVLGDLGRSRRTRALGAALAGAAATVGLGWRPDTALLVPFGFLFLAARVLLARRPAAEIVGPLAAFAAGAALTFWAIASLGPVGDRPPSIGFHIAYYGAATRSNVLGIENTFQASRDDAQTHFLVAAHADANGRGTVPYGGAAYATACRDAFLAAVRHDGWRWLQGYPRFLAAALAGLGAPGTLQSIAPELRARVVPPALRGVHAWLLDPLVAVLPLLALAGAATALAGARDRLLAAALVAFAAGYGFVLLAVLPEPKHFGPLVLPLAVLSAQVVRLPALLRGRRGGQRIRVPWRRIVAGLVLAGGAALAVRALATATRGGYVEEVERRLPGAVDVPETLRDARTFLVVMEPGATPDPQGYVLDLEAGEDPGVLVCRHLRGREGEPAPRIAVTRHPLRAGQTARFVVTALQGGRYGDIRTYGCLVELPPGARFTRARRIDLAGWTAPLITTVLDRGPGAPRLPPGAAAYELAGGSSEERASRLESLLIRSP